MEHEMKPRIIWEFVSLYLGNYGIKVYEGHAGIFKSQQNGPIILGWHGDM